MGKEAYIEKFLPLSVLIIIFLLSITGALITFGVLQSYGEYQNPTVKLAGAAGGFASFFILATIAYLRIKGVHDKLPIKEKRIKHLREKIKNLEKEVENADFVCTDFFFHTIRDIFRLNANGDAEVKSIMNVENTSNEKISKISYPYYYDVYDKDDLKNGPLVTLNKVEINGRNPKVIKDFIEHRGYLHIKSDDDEILEHGHLNFIFDEVGGGIDNNSGQVIASVEYSVRNAFSKMKEREMIHAHVLTKANELTIEVIPPEGKLIRVKKDRKCEEGINVCNLTNQLSYRNEIDRVNKPHVSGNENLQWKIDKPKIGLDYILYFEVLEKP